MSVLIWPMHISNAQDTFMKKDSYAEEIVRKGLEEVREAFKRDSIWKCKSALENFLEDNYNVHTEERLVECGKWSISLGIANVEDLSGNELDDKVIETCDSATEFLIRWIVDDLKGVAYTHSFYQRIDWSAYDAVIDDTFFSRTKIKHADELDLLEIDNLNRETADEVEAILVSKSIEESAPGHKWEAPNRFLANLSERVSPILTKRDKVYLNSRKRVYRKLWRREQKEKFKSRQSVSVQPLDERRPVSYTHLTLPTSDLV